MILLLSSSLSIAKKINTSWQVHAANLYHYNVDGKVERQHVTRLNNENVFVSDRGYWVFNDDFSIKTKGDVPYSPYAIGNTREGDLFKIECPAVKFAGQYFTKKKRLGLFIDGEEIGKYRDLDKEFSLDISGECSLKISNK